MMKFPDDWEFSIRYLADLHQDKKAAVTTGLEKLIELGYIAKVGSQQRNKQGTFSTYDYVIFEDPTDNPKFIPYRHGKAETTVSDFQTTESRIGEITATDFQIADDISTETAVNSSNDVSDDYKTVADNQTAVEALQCTLSDYRITDYPATDYRLTDNQPITNTVDTNTFYTNTFLPNIEEDDDDTCTRVYIEVFQWKFINSYLNEYLNAPSEKERICNRRTKYMNSDEIRKNLDKIIQKQNDLLLEIRMDKEELDSLKNQKIVLERSLRQAVKLEEDFARRMKALETELNQAIYGAGEKDIGNAEDH